MNEILRDLSVPSANGPKLPAAYDCQLTDMINYLMVTFVALEDDLFKLRASAFSFFFSTHSSRNDEERMR
ncbi:Ribonuclease [Dirofilaria immitis]